MLTHTPVFSSSSCRLTTRMRQPNRFPQWFRSIFGIAAVVVALIGLRTIPVHAQDLLPNDKARVIEWDCPLLGDEVQPGAADPEPGALIAEGDFVWFATRANPRLVRFTPGNPLDTAPGT